MGEMEKTEHHKTWSCLKCGHEITTSLLNDSAIRFFGKDSREFLITYDIITTVCPNCGSVQEKESPLLNIAIEKTLNRDKAPKKGRVVIMSANPRDALVSNIRIEAWGIKDRKDYLRMFPDENITMPTKEKNQFLALLHENERKVYKIMLDEFSGTIDDPEIIESIKEKMGMPSLEEADRRYNEVLQKLRDFRQEHGKGFINS